MTLQLVVQCLNQLYHCLPRHTCQQHFEVSISYNNTFKLVRSTLTHTHTRARAHAQTLIRVISHVTKAFFFWVGVCNMGNIFLHLKAYYRIGVHIQEPLGEASKPCVF